MYHFNKEKTRQRLHDLDLAQGHFEDDDAGGHPGPAVRDEEGGIDVIPLYCAALGAVVVGLLAYVFLVHYRRMRDKRLAREPHEDVEYSKASGADSGVFADPDHHLHTLHHQQQQHLLQIHAHPPTGKAHTGQSPYPIFLNLNFCHLEIQHERSVIWGFIIVSRRIE